MYLAGCRLIHELFMIDTVAGTEGQKNWNGLIKDQLNEECFSFYVSGSVRPNLYDFPPHVYIWPDL